MGTDDPTGTGTEDELTPDEEAKFGRFLERHQAAEKARAERRKEPKDFGEVLDRLSDEVCDKMAERFGLVPAGEEPPERDDAPAAGGGGKVMGWLTGDRAGGKAAAG